MVQGLFISEVVTSLTLFFREAMVEMSEISTPTSSSCNVVQASVEPLDDGVANPSFNAHEDTVC